jgi:hypothetical protein
MAVMHRVYFLTTYNNALRGEVRKVKRIEAMQDRRHALHRILRSILDALSLPPFLRALQNHRADLEQRLQHWEPVNSILTHHIVSIFLQKTINEFVTKSFHLHIHRRDFDVLILNRE